jgi:opacity protein-like surface antigen
MKKIIATLALMGLVFAAQAVELGVNASRDTAGTDRTGYGVTVGQKFGAAGITAGFDRYTTGTELDKYSVVGSYDVTKIGSATLAVKAGAAYLNPKSGDNGYAALVGAGVSIPLTQSIAATVDYRYQAGQSRVKSLDGSTVTAGLKLAF